MTAEVQAHLLADGVGLEQVGHVARIALNRPGARNAIIQAPSFALGDAADRAATSYDLRVVVLQGEAMAFCAGQDLKALDVGEPLGLPGHPEKRSPVWKGR